MNDAIQMVLSDLRFRERLLQTWGMTWEEAYTAITEALRQWEDGDRLQLPPGFLGTSGYKKADEL